MSKIRNEETLLLIKKACEGDSLAMEELIKEYQGLVASYAGRLAKWSGLELSDLMQEGALGFVKAIKTYDPEKASFTTHATNHIKWAMHGAIYENGSSIKIPRNILVRVHQITKIGHELAKQNGWDSDSPYGNDEIMAIAEEAGIAWEEAEYLLSLAELVKIKSLDEPIGKSGRMGEKDNLTISDTHSAATVDERAEEINELAQSKSLIDSCIGTLPPREAMIIQMRYGLTDGKPRTYSELSQEFGVTCETIMQIEAKAIRMLRHPSRQKLMREKHDSKSD